MAVKDLISLGLTNTADGTEQLITLGLEAASNVTLELTGVASTSGIGSVDYIRNIAITGVVNTSDISSVGAFAEGAASISGVENTSAVGTVGFTKAGSVALTGVLATSAVETPGNSASIGVTGEEATTGVGTVTFTLSSNVDLVGVEGTSAVGTILSVGGDFTAPELYLKRDTGIYISKGGDTVRLNVKDFSFNTSSRIENVSRNILDPTQARGIAPHIAAIAPVSFSFTTYILPEIDTNVTSPEEYLWVSLMGSDSVTSNSTSSTIDFADGNVGSLQELTIWFDQPNKSRGSYRLDNAVVDEATINFDINGIAEIQWTGRALSINIDDAPSGTVDRTTANNYLKNKFSIMTLVANSNAYNLALTGGSISFKNNNIFYGRNQIGVTTTPVGHYTGNRLVTGNLNVYLKHSPSASTNFSIDLHDDIEQNAANVNYESTWLANIVINIAGTSGPNVQLNIPQAVMELPQFGFSDLITLNIPFIAKEETGNYNSVVYNIPAAGQDADNYLLENGDNLRMEGAGGFVYLLE